MGGFILRIGAIGLGVLLHRAFQIWLWNKTDPENKMGADKRWIRTICMSFWVAMPLSGVLVIIIASYL